MQKVSLSNLTAVFNQDETVIISNDAVGMVSPTVLSVVFVNNTAGGVPIDYTLEIMTPPGIEHSCLLRSACMVCTAGDNCYDRALDFRLLDAINGTLYGTELNYTCPLAWEFENPEDPALHTLPFMTLQVGWDGNWTPRDQPGTCIGET